MSEEEIKKVDAEIVAKPFNVPEYDKVVASTVEEQEAALEENTIGKLEDEEIEEEQDSQE